MKKINNNAVIQAMFIGSLTGLLGVLLLIGFLKMPIQQQGEDVIAVQTSQEQQEEVQAVQEVEEVVQVFYALQHGVFSSFESAASFVASYPTLNKAAIVNADAQYFVWSRLDIEKLDAALTVVPSAFYKKVTLHSSCQTPTELQLPKTLKDTKWLTLQAVNSTDEAMVPEDWTLRASEVLKLSTNPNVVRLHLTKNYFEQLECLKITF